MDHALYKAKNGGRNRVETDRRSKTDTVSDHMSTAAVRLVWRSAHEYDEPTIDEQHRLLFDPGNALFDATIEAEKNLQAALVALETIIVHLQQHFADEEAILAEHRYKDTHRRQDIRSALNARADEIEAAAKSGNASLGPLVEFRPDISVSEHLFHEDKTYYIFSTTTGP